MRRHILTALFLFAGIMAKAQMVQYGKVVEMNSHGKKLSGVSITIPSAHDCQPTSSDSYGTFRLCFGEHRTGDVVVGIRAQKYGYEVVNLHVTRDGWTLTTKDTLKIVMAPTEKLMEARMKYYDMLEMACVSRYDATMSFLNEQYAQHKISNVEYQYWKVQTDDELKQAYASMDANADRLARIDEDDMSADEIILMQMVSANDMTGVVALLAGDDNESVLQAYNDFSLTFPMVENETNVSAIVATDETEMLDDDAAKQVADSIKEDILTLQTYAKLFESEFSVSNAKYAKSCLYLGLLYKKIGYGEASEKYLVKALKMYELLTEQGKDYEKELGTIRKELDANAGK